MTEDDAARGLPTCPATYLLRDGIPVCTTCGAVIGGADADQIRHSGRFGAGLVTGGRGAQALADQARVHVRDRRRRDRPRVV